jgi:NAD(P)-dependent dehydrogenase (short-subunit alcohol dehydrogenase family)
VSADGYELRFAVNYLAPVLCTRLLVPLLRRSPPARVVNVASAGQEALDFDDPMLVGDDFDGGRAYRRSKLALVMFTFDLAEELRGSGVTVNCLHPATLMPTKMTREAGFTPTSSLDQGLVATLHLIASADTAGATARYYDGLGEASAHAQAYVVTARQRLRRLTEGLLEPPNEAGLPRKLGGGLP